MKHDITCLLDLNYSCSKDEIVTLIKYDLSCDYYGIMQTIISGSNLLQKEVVTKEDMNEFNRTADTLYYPVDNCLVISSDSDKFLDKLKTNNISINQGPKSNRGLVSRMDNHLSLLDLYKK